MYKTVPESSFIIIKSKMNTRSSLKTAEQGGIKLSLRLPFLHTITSEKKTHFLLI